MAAEVDEALERIEGALRASVAEAFAAAALATESPAAWQVLYRRWTAEELPVLPPVGKAANGASVRNVLLAIQSRFTPELRALKEWAVRNDALSGEYEARLERLEWRLARLDKDETANYLKKLNPAPSTQSAFARAASKAKASLSAADGGVVSHAVTLHRCPHCGAVRSVDRQYGQCGHCGGDLFVRKKET